MKTYILVLILVITSSVRAQQPLDTIYANEQKNVALFFPNPIRQGITGSSHYVFTYNREQEQFFGLIQALPGEDSNLLVITRDGQAYSYILKYADELPKLNYFISKAESIGNERPRTVENKIKAEDSIVEKERDYQRTSEYLLNSTHKTVSIVYKNRIKLRLRNMIYTESEVYMVLEIRNKSGIDFEVDYLNVYRIKGNKRRRSSYQKLQIEAIYKYKMPGIIKNGESVGFAYVLPKFVLGKNEKLQLELQEFKGNRKIILNYN